MTTAAAQPMTRVFKTGSVQLPDPDPGLPPDEVRKLYAVSYPHLASATVGEPVATGDTLQYEFVPPVVKTKG